MTSPFLPVFLGPGQLTDAGLDYFGELAEHIDWMRHVCEPRDGLPWLAGGSGTFSNFAETKVLAHLAGQDNASWANLSPIFLALCTAVPDSSKTGSTITEATYTGYARVSLANTVWGTATSGGAGAASSITNSSTITFAGCTAGSSTITGWALTTAVTAGESLAWGSATSTVISTTQTPATVAASGLQLQLT